MKRREGRREEEEREKGLTGVGKVFRVSCLCLLIRRIFIVDDRRSLSFRNLGVKF